MQGTPCLLCWVWTIPEKLQTAGFEDIHTFLKPPKLKICMGKNCLPWLFPDPLTNSLTFLTEWKPCPCWLVEIPKSQTKTCVFYEHPWEFCFFLGATHNSICSWKNVMTFYFYPYFPFKNVTKIFMKSFCLSFSFDDMQIDSFSNATRKCAK